MGRGGAAEFSRNVTHNEKTSHNTGKYENTENGLNIPLRQFYLLNTVTFRVMDT